MLTRFQEELIPVLMRTRSERSYFAGGTTLNYSLPRCSSDFDIFHDEHEMCAKAFITDIDLLKAHGYSIEILRTPEKNGIGEVVVSNGIEKTEIQWATDSVYRFFPIEKDDCFGFQLNYHDLAMNKILALAGRSEVRDYYDVCEMIATNKPVIAYIWAACAKDPGYTPLSLLEYMSMNTKYQNEDFFSIYSKNKLDIRFCKDLFLRMSHEAREQFQLAPIDEYGCLYLKKETYEVFFPDKDDFENGNYIKHFARPFGSIPQFQVEEDSGPSPF